MAIPSCETKKTYAYIKHISKNCHVLCHSSLWNFNSGFNSASGSPSAAQQTPASSQSIGGRASAAFPPSNRSISNPQSPGPAPWSLCCSRLPPSFWMGSTLTTGLLSGSGTCYTLSEDKEEEEVFPVGPVLKPSTRHPWLSCSPACGLFAKVFFVFVVFFCTVLEFSSILCLSFAIP